MGYLQRLLLALLFLCPSYIYAQIDVDGVIDDPGDIAFLALKRTSTKMDGYAFVFLDDCPPGTSIIFDDEEWDGSGWIGTGEGANTWTNNTGEKITIGTVIIVEMADDMPEANIGSVTESNLGFTLANGNDGIFAYVGTYAATDVNFIAFAGDINAPGNQTLNGTGLVAGLTAFDDETLGTGTDEGVYTDMSCCIGDQTACLQMINNTANWTMLGVAGASFPASVPTSVGIPEAAPTITPSTSATCGEQITLDIDGCLNTDTEWVVYTGSCGGTEVASTTSDEVMFTPTSTTTYYIRGENTSCGTVVGECMSVTITVDKVSTAVAGDDQANCNSASFTMAATPPTDGTGTWTVNSGTATIADINSATTTITVAAGNTAELKWTVSSGSCTVSEDLVELTNNAAPSTAAAGDAQSQCGNETFTMAANTPITGTGVWTVQSGTATITDATSPTTTITVAAGNSAELTWTISATGCPDSESTVQLTNNTEQTTATAGDTQSQCGDETFTMTANTPTTGTGVWTVQSGTAIIADAASPTTIVTVAAGNSAALKWTISTTGCPDSESTIQLTNNANPTADIIVTENSETANDNTVCVGDKATLTASGGTSYTWNADASLSATDIAAPLATPSAMTTYIVTVTDDNNCSATAMTTLNVTLKVLAPTDTKNHNLDAEDPCSCGDPLNQVIGNKTLFHDILTVTSTAGRSIWISAADTEFKDVNNSILPTGVLPTSDPGGNAGGTGTGTLVPETSTPGVYQLDFYHFEKIATTITFTDGTTSESFTSSKCNSCVVVPTMNEWGLFIFGLLLLNLGVGLVYKKEALGKC